MPIINKRNSERLKNLRELANNHEIALSEFTICVSEDEYRFPTKQNVPDGSYISEVKKVYARAKNGRGILDIGYEITAKNGAVYHIMQSYPQNTIYLNKFYQAMLAAGLNVGDSPDKYIGVKEEIVLAYPSESTGLGSIVHRVPLKVIEEKVSMQDETDYLDDRD